MTLELSRLDRRAAAHRALGEPHRLAIVDALWLSDRSPSELQAVTGLTSNLLTFHLDTLQRAGLVDRHTSQGDARRRYVRLRHDALAEVAADPDLVVSVCDRARETALPWSTPLLHWSVTDPAGHERPAFEAAFADLETRLTVLADALQRSAA